MNSPDTGNYSESPITITVTTSDYQPSIFIKYSFFYTPILNDTFHYLKYLVIRRIATLSFTLETPALLHLSPDLYRSC